MKFPSDKLLTITDLSEGMQVTKKAIYKWLSEESMPQPSRIKQGDRKRAILRWDPDVINAWLEGFVDPTQKVEILLTRERGTGTEGSYVVSTLGYQGPIVRHWSYSSLHPTRTREKALMAARDYARALKKTLEHLFPTMTIKAGEDL